MPQEAEACLAGVILGVPLPSVICPAGATRLSPTGWHGYRFPLARRHRTRNGADKTTTVRILAGLVWPDRGHAGFDAVS